MLILLLFHILNDFCPINSLGTTASVGALHPGLVHTLGVLNDRPNALYTHSASIVDRSSKNCITMAKRSEVSFSIPRRDVAEETNCCNFLLFFLLFISARDRDAVLR